MNPIKSLNPGDKEQEFELKDMEIEFEVRTSRLID